MNKPLTKGGLFVVMATHPKMPNHTRNSRGRVQHLAESAEQDSLTLCNMLVSFGYNEHDNFYKPCVVCMAKLKLRERRQKQIDKSKAASAVPFKYSFTINTDASYSHNHGGVAAYAFWIKSAHYKLTHAELITEPVANSSIAELIAVENALWMLDHYIDDNPFLRSRRDENGIRLYLNTDSQWTINALEGRIKRSQHLDIARRVANIPSHYELICRHIKSHQKKNGPDFGTSRQWVNDWCDREAKALVREKLREIEHA